MEEVPESFFALSSSSSSSRIRAACCSNCSACSANCAACFAIAPRSSSMIMSLLTIIGQYPNHPDQRGPNSGTVNGYDWLEIKIPLGYQY